MIIIIIIIIIIKKENYLGSQFENSTHQGQKSPATEMNVHILRKMS